MYGPALRAPADGYRLIGKCSEDAAACGWGADCVPRPKADSESGLSGKTLDIYFVRAGHDTRCCAPHPVRSPKFRATQAQRDPERAYRNMRPMAIKARHPPSRPTLVPATSGPMIESTTTPAAAWVLKSASTSELNADPFSTQLPMKMGPPMKSGSRPTCRNHPSVSTP